MPDKIISIRTAGVAIVVKLWRQFRGKSFGPTERDDLGFALNERGHWVATVCVERWLKQLAAILGETSELYLAILAAWTEYARDQNARANRLRLQIPKRRWTWCLSDADGDVSCSPEELFEPSSLLYSLEPLPCALGSADWVKEVLAVDGHEPWRNCWVDVPAAHPYNTSFALQPQGSAVCTDGVQLPASRLSCSSRPFAGSLRRGPKTTRSITGLVLILRRKKKTTGLYLRAI
ncbi:hypothetical protein PF003_g29442 [Phytophthora fragariae]|uniref:Uncharacterized protein n=1 Tax=Phytophthora fragariae TaxID=53985 RepID=A0A6A3FFV2_9STRA|nr:hypothetical protein PF003_g29442 [Phytophthora fragariae]KAE8944954.1 hypothetical protein PF009_g5380 [Phytophthora fragariae]